MWAAHVQSACLPTPLRSLAPCAACAPTLWAMRACICMQEATPDIAVAVGKGFVAPGMMAAPPPLGSARGAAPLPTMAAMPKLGDDRRTQPGPGDPTPPSQSPAPPRPSLSGMPVGQGQGQGQTLSGMPLGQGQGQALSGRPVGQGQGPVWQAGGPGLEGHWIGGSSQANGLHSYRGPPLSAQAPQRGGARGVVDMEGNAGAAAGAVAADVASGTTGEGGHDGGQQVAPPRSPMQSAVELPRALLQQQVVAAAAATPPQPLPLPTFHTAFRAASSSPHPGLGPLQGDVWPPPPPAMAAFIQVSPTHLGALPLRNSSLPPPMLSLPPPMVPLPPPVALPSPSTREGSVQLLRWQVSSYGALLDSSGGPYAGSALPRSP